MALTNKEIYSNPDTIANIISDMPNNQRAIMTDTPASFFNNNLIYKYDGDFFQLAVGQKYTGGAWVAQDVEVAELRCTGLSDSFVTTAIPIGESGETALDGAFTATSFVGALNEVKAGAGGTPAHNDTTSKQGGTGGEYYHLTSAQHTLATSLTSGGSANDSLRADGTYDPVVGGSSDSEILFNASGAVTGEDWFALTIDQGSVAKELVIWGSTSANNNCRLITYTNGDAKISANSEDGAFFTITANYDNGGATAERTTFNAVGSGGLYIQSQDSYIYIDSNEDIDIVATDDIILTAGAGNTITAERSLSLLEQAYFDLQTATGDGTTAIDWREGNKFNLTLGAFDETVTYSNAPSGACNLVLWIKQDATGGRTVTLPTMTAMGAAISIATGSNAITIVSIYYDGTDYYATSVQEYTPA